AGPVRLRARESWAHHAEAGAPGVVSGTGLGEDRSMGQHDRTSGAWASSEAVRRSMRANRGRDTGPELAVRRAIHARGLRYRVDARPVPTLNRRADPTDRPSRSASSSVTGARWRGWRPAWTSVAWPSGR